MLLGNMRISKKTAEGGASRLKIRALVQLAGSKEVKRNAKGEHFFRFGKNVWQVELNKAQRIKGIYLVGSVANLDKLGVEL